MNRFVQRSKPSTSRPPLATGTGNSNKRPEGSAQRTTPTKRRRVAEVKDSEDEEDESQSGGFISNLGDSEDEMSKLPPRETAFESSLPAVSTDKEAIEQYEAMRSSQQQDTADDTATRLEKRQWVPGKSSIYVDAFNLALETVLEDESHLFDDKEKHVFEQWKSLSYETQYLYVRLFLRKTASWHRVERLQSSYSNDITDINLAIEDLLEARELPEDGTGSPQEKSSDDLEAWSLGDTFTFADDSQSHITTMADATPLLSLDELKALAKDAKVQGKNKADLVKALCRTSARQAGLLSLGLSRQNTNESTASRDQESEDSQERTEVNRDSHFLRKILATTGPLIRLSEPIFKLFERVHLVFYRSTEWTEKSLTTIILAKIARRNHPDYIVCRSSNIFDSRRSLLEFELSMRKDFEVDKVLEFSGPPGEAGFLKVLEIFESISDRWRELLKQEQHREDHVYEFGEGSYLRRFNAAHAFTRVAHKAAYVLGRLHRYREEHALLTELLSQHLFHPARRGSWYQRKALLEERYMWEVDPDPVSTSPETQKKHWQQIALITCETALEDRDCHLIYHYDLQKRLIKLEKRLRVPRRLQHDFGHVKLREPEEHTVQGIQLVRDDPDLKGKNGRGPSTKTTWLDELGEPDKDEKPAHVSVEEMCLSHYRNEGWKGYHSEGGILRTLFAYLFFDVLFVYVPNVFQTAFQTCPLDLHTDVFYPARASRINHQLVEIANGGGEKILREVYEREHEKRTCVVGLNWDFEIDDLVELVSCFNGNALAAVCKVMAEDYRARGGGVPDLVLWRTTGNDVQANGDDNNSQKGEVMFAEVKSANDRLSDTQRLWIHVLTGAGVRVALCNAVAREVRTLL
ncbi:VRR-NUC domain-containing protein [Apiosordaria backusii]|uniref:Fanconi-associated nuclease n=1 Tax=Apiosordaria backusii TaxID=314023 RepID=A0AA40AXY2_9PEZI|nr:VRR-NUC domain-containing protein [Apiosordaria backusii]